MEMSKFRRKIVCIKNFERKEKGEIENLQWYVSKSEDLPFFN